MSILVAQREGLDYVPKYLFLSTDEARETHKSRHVMKEFLRKRDSIRRQKQSTARAQSRVLPWLRREDTQQPRENVVEGCFEISIDTPPSPPYETSSNATTPQHSQLASDSSVADPYECTSTSLCTQSASRPIQNFAQDSHRDLLDYMNRVLICRLNETTLENNYLSPTTLLNNHILTRPLPAMFLHATISLSRDNESGPGRPSPETISLLLDGLTSLKEQIQTQGVMSDDRILAVINLWIYEATLIMDVPSMHPSRGVNKPHQPLSSTDQEKIQAHISGLQKLIACHGGLQNLTLECQWALAWCVSTLPGYFPPSKLSKPISSSSHSLPNSEKSKPFSLVVAKLANIKKLLAAVNFQCTFLNQAEFLRLKVVLYRLGTMLQSRRCQRTPLQKLARATSTISILLFILDIIFGSIEDLGDTNLVCRPPELLEAQQRLVSQRLDQEGSFEKAWQVLMMEDEPPILKLHPRAWSIVETTNVLKHLNLTTLNSLSKMLMSFLLPGSWGVVGEFGFDKVLSQIRIELEGIPALS